MDFIQKNSENDDIVWKFCQIIGHQGPLKPSDPEYQGSQFNICIEWENGEITNEPLGIIAADDPTTCAMYAQENDLLEEPGWRQFRCLAMREKQLLCLINQAKVRSFRTAPRYKFGYPVPCTYEEAAKLDLQNGNAKWQDAIRLEMEQLWEYECFVSHGIHSKDLPPDGYERICVHFVFDVKHDGRHKALMHCGWTLDGCSH